MKKKYADEPSGPSVPEHIPVSEAQSDWMGCYSP